MEMTRRAMMGMAAGLPLAGCAADLSRAHVSGAQLTTALDRADELAAILRGKRVAVLTHAAGVNRAGERSIDVIARLPDVRLAAIWSPEHGLAGAAAAGDHVGDGRDAATGVAITSLYGHRKAPSAAMLAGVDAVFVDLQDVGTRAYTYASTVFELLKAAAKSGTRIFLNDRPNPIGGEEIEGPVLDPPIVSFVGIWPIPLRHGLSLGELAQMMNGEALGDAAPIGAPLTILKMQGWNRRMGAAAFGPGGLPFVPPSPNLRSTDAMHAFAGTVLFEGTTVSEGRGTSKPFETLCAPFLDPSRLAAAIPATLPFIPGATLRFGTVTPIAARYKGQNCGAIHLQITDAARYKPVHTALALIAALFKIYPDKMGFLPDNPAFFDSLMGDKAVRDAFQTGGDINQIESRWQRDLAAFRVRRIPYLLYV